MFEWNVATASLGNTPALAPYHGDTGMITPVMAAAQQQKFQQDMATKQLADKKNEQLWALRDELSQAIGAKDEAKARIIAARLQQEHGDVFKMGGGDPAGIQYHPGQQGVAPNTPEAVPVGGTSGDTNVPPWLQKAQGEFESGATKQVAPSNANVPSWLAAAESRLETQEGGTGPALGGETQAYNPIEPSGPSANASPTASLGAIGAASGGLGGAVLGTRPVDMGAANRDAAAELVDPYNRANRMMSRPQQQEPVASQEAAAPAPVGLGGNRWDLRDSLGRPLTGGSYGPQESVDIVGEQLAPLMSRYPEIGKQFVELGRQLAKTMPQEKAIAIALDQYQKATHDDAALQRASVMAQAAAGRGASAGSVKMGDEKSSREFGLARYKQFASENKVKDLKTSLDDARKSVANLASGNSAAQSIAIVQMTKASGDSRISDADRRALASVFGANWLDKFNAAIASNVNLVTGMSPQQLAMIRQVADNMERKNRDLMLASYQAAKQLLTNPDVGESERNEIISAIRADFPKDMYAGDPDLMYVGRAAPRSDRVGTRAAAPAHGAAPQKAAAAATEADDHDLVEP